MLDQKSKAWTVLFLLLSLDVHVLRAKRESMEKSTLSMENEDFYGMEVQELDEYDVEVQELDESQSIAWMDAALNQMVKDIEFDLERAERKLKTYQQSEARPKWTDAQCNTAKDKWFNDADKEWMPKSTAAVVKALAANKQPSPYKTYYWQKGYSNRLDLQETALASGCAWADLEKSPETKVKFTEIYANVEAMNPCADKVTEVSKSGNQDKASPEFAATERKAFALMQFGVRTKPQCDPEQALKLLDEKTPSAAMPSQQFFREAKDAMVTERDAAKLAEKYTDEEVGLVVVDGQEELHVSLIQNGSSAKDIKPRSSASISGSNSSSRFPLGSPRDLLRLQAEMAQESMDAWVSKKISILDSFKSSLSSSPAHGTADIPAEQQALVQFGADSVARATTLRDTFFVQTKDDGVWRIVHLLSFFATIFMFMLCGGALVIAVIGALFWCALKKFLNYMWHLVKKAGKAIANAVGNAGWEQEKWNSPWDACMTKWWPASLFQQDDNTFYACMFFFWTR